MKRKIIYICGTVLLLIALILFNCFVVNTNQLQIRNETITSEKIDEDLNDFVIAYFSDLHYDGFIQEELIDECIEKINNYCPDVIIFGGDLIDKLSTKSLNQNSQDYLINKLSELKANYGKYAVIGNHDHEDNERIDIVSDIYANSDFKLLKNKNVSIYVDNNSFINIVGLDSSSYTSLDDEVAFSNVDSNAYTIVVSHTPDSFDDIQDQNFDYMLVGHSHGGQVYIPIINLLTRNFGYQNYLRGKVNKNNKTMDISNGVGNTKYNARLLADSEIVIYKLQQK